MHKALHPRDDTDYTYQDSVRAEGVGKYIQRYQPIPARKQDLVFINKKKKQGATERK